MDCSNMPSCLRLGEATTMPIRLTELNMAEDHHRCSSSRQTRCSCGKQLPEPSSCEQFSRTRTNSQNSDCDSDTIVDKCRTYRTRAAKTKYINVWAAVSLLLVISALSPQSSAAPYRSRAMDRLATEEQEDQLWGNPCDIGETVEDVNVEYTSEMPKKIRTFIGNAITYIDSFKNEFTCELHGNARNYDQVLVEWTRYDWMENFVDPAWYRPEVSPRNAGTDVVDSIMKSNLDDVLPSMYKGLKVTLAAMNMISQRLPYNGAKPTDLLNKLQITKAKVKTILCEFTEMMAARKLKILPLYNTELPDLQGKNRVEVATLVFRDTLDYLRYLDEIMQAMSRTNQ